MNFFRKTLPALALASALLLSACATTGPSGGVPSESEINAQAAKAYADVKTKSKLSPRTDWNAIVQRVASRIARASGEHFQWEYVLIESPEVNAWCMPGGKIAVYTGIMPVVQTEAGLAAVLGHEVAHATRRHGLKQYARASTENTVGLLVGGAAILGGQLLCKSTTCRALTAVGGVAAGFGVAFFDRKFSRGDETEADQVGQRYMARAGYEPAEAVRLWERMGAAMAGKAPPEWFSTHPSDERRRNNLKTWLPQAEADYAQAPQKFGTGEAVRN